MSEKGTSTQDVEVVEEVAGHPVKFENASASEMIPQVRRFYNAEDIKHDLGVSDSTAYKIIRDINDKLKERGLMTFRGRVLKRAYLEMTGGGC